MLYERCLYLLRTSPFSSPACALLASDGYIYPHCVGLADPYIQYREDFSGKMLAGVDLDYAVMDISPARID